LEEFVAELALTRQRRIIATVRFPEPGECQGPDGGELSRSDWENQQTDSFIYQTNTPSRKWKLAVSRKNRAAEWR
jgi:hypothetical protein